LKIYGIEYLVYLFRCLYNPGQRKTTPQREDIVAKKIIRNA